MDDQVIGPEKTNEFSSNTLGKGKLDEEFLTDNIDEEEYDALNDETFGGGSFDIDWEESHDRYAEMLVDINKEGISPSGNSGISSFFESSVCDGDETQQEIVSKSISQLGLEDDLDDPAIMTVGRSRTIWSVDPVFRSSPPPPAIIDPELCGSPKTHSIWSTNQSSVPLNDHSVGSLFQLVSNSSNAYQTCVSPLSPCASKMLPSQVPQKAWTLEEVERNFLSPAGQAKSSIHEWNDIPNNVEKSLHGICSNGVQSPVNLQGTSKEFLRTDIPGMLHLPKASPIHSTAARTLDEVEKDLLKFQVAATIDLERNLKSAAVENDMKGMRWSAPCEPFLRFPSPIARPANRCFRVAQPAYPPIMAPRIMGNHPMPVRIGSNVKDSRFNNVYERMPRPPPVFYPTSVLDPQRMNFAFIGPSGRVVRHPLLEERARREKLKERHDGQLLRYAAEINGHDYSQHEEAYASQHSLEGDEYVGLMSQREKEWLLRIQLMLVHTDNPYVEDFYYSTFLTRKCAMDALKNKSGSKASPKLLLPEKGKTESRTYVPAQFEGSLGKLQAVSVNYPRKVLDISVRRPQEDEETTNINSQNWKKYRRILLDIENLYRHLLEIDDEEKRILALPDDAHLVHKENIIRLTDKLIVGLGCESKDDTFQNIMSIRKGRNLGLRSFEVFSKNQKMYFLRALFRCFASILRRDQSDMILVKNSDLILDFIKTLSLKELVFLGESFENLPCTADTVIMSGMIREKSNVAGAFKNKFGSSSISCMLQRAEDLYSGVEVIGSEAQARWAKIVLHIVDVICALPEMSFVPPSVPNSDLLQHFQRFAVDRDKFEILKEKVNIFQSIHMEPENV